MIEGTSIVLAVVVSLTFLWFANVNSPVWHRIAIQSWMASTVTSSTLVLRVVLGLQVGIIASMLSSFSLEKMGVRTRDLASSSIMRSGHGSVLESVRISIVSLAKGGMPLRHAGPVWALLLLLLVSVASQFASTLLVNNLRISALTGIPLSADISTNRNDTSDGPWLPGVTANTSRGTTWEIKPTMYPSFADYFETNSGNSSTDGIVDTGALLRAFLPLQNQTDRNNLQGFDGRATILDARVSCVRLKLSDPVLHWVRWDDDNITDVGQWVLLTRIKPALTPSSLFLSPTGSIDTKYFGCLADIYGNKQVNS